MAENRLMKDGLDVAALDRVTKSLSSVVPAFKASAFRRFVLNGLPALELKQRVEHIIAAMHRYLPEDFRQTAGHLSKVPEIWDYGDREDPLSGFAAWPITDYVGAHGLHHPDVSLRLLKKLTPLFSAEFAIRPFITQHYDKTYAALQKWSVDKNEHVRRLVSEGTRPRLPWGKQLPQFISDPQPVITLLECLKDDSSLYVRRSVANNLNDISKDNADIMLSVCRRWHKSASQERKWIIRHATRSLVKAGNPAVFPLLGYSSKPKIKLGGFKLSKKLIHINDSIEFDFFIESTSGRKQRLIVDYVIHFMKANGKLAPKVFKLKSIDIAARQKIKMSQKHPIKKITTRRYYSGKHKINILINGIEQKGLSFVLDV